MGDARAAVRFLAGLPYEQWAIRLRTGHGRLNGRLREVHVVVGGHRIRLGPGPATLELMFLGGTRPVLAAVDVETALELDGRSGRRLRVADGTVMLDDGVLEATGQPLNSAALVTALLDNLGDVTVVVRARPEGNAVARLPEGIEVGMAGTDEIVIRARAVGPPEALVLAEPMELRFGRHGVRLDHQRARWLARLAKVRIRGAQLHPDGRVVLDGTAARGIERMARGGLRTASAHLSGLVRRSPRFHRIREFLRSR